MTAPRGLHTLARLHGIQTAYQDNEGRRVPASPDALMATLQALGVPVRAAAAIPSQLAHRRRALWERAVPPVVVAWTPAEAGLDGEAAGTVVLRTPDRLRDRPVRVQAVLEGGGERTLSRDGPELEVTATEECGGAFWIKRSVPLPPVPPGYHDLHVEVGAGGPAVRRFRTLLIAAPERAAGWADLPGPNGSRWGLFAPLYALHESGSPRAPDFSLLGRLGEAVADAGGSVVGTLPLLAGFLDSPYEPSPYAPVSRLFWNELYIAPADGDTRAPEGRTFDPHASMARKRPQLEAEAREFFEVEGPEEESGADPSPGGGHSRGGPPELASFLARQPLAEDYARFRALTERLGSWHRWPDRLRARDVRRDDYDQAVARYHLYVQYRAERQLAEVAQRGIDQGVSLYLDLPLGVHPAGYDVWRERGLFAGGATVGAPPDPLARGGQDWGFPPLHPEASRLQGHRYFIEAVRTHLRFARVLRIDHVMQLHRMFWIAGRDARDGVYVKYPAEELYAVLSLESHRAGAVIVGEDLGTVPRYVRRTMRRRGVPGMYVAQFELTERTADAGEAEGAGGDGADGGGVLVPKAVPARALASIGTHDTPTFAGWWWGDDLRIRRELGELTEEEAASELRGRGIMREKLVRGLSEVSAPDRSEVDVEAAEGADPAESAGSRELARSVEAALLRRLGRSDAGLVLATMEDLWLEREPQNVPGTPSERNWRWRSRRSLAGLRDPDVAALLRVLNEAREGSQ